MDCLHETIDVDDGERVCTCCGTIIGSFIDESAEWRVYGTTDEDPTRTGTITSELLPNSSYGSMMMRKRIPNHCKTLCMVVLVSRRAFLDGHL